jgi:RNA polymerase sigma factor (sigma-70 family)
MGESVIERGRAASAWEVRDASVESFEQLFEAHKRPAYRLALLLCGGEAATAEDAVSEAFAQVLPRWRAGAVDDFGAYLRRSIVNQVKRTFLRRGFQRRADLLLDAPPVDGVEDQVVRKELLWGALRTLPPKQRAAVVLHYYEALPIEDVATAMGTSVGTAKSHLSRGRDRLRALLGSER